MNSKPTNDNLKSIVDLTGSIVTYKNDPSVLRAAVESFLNTNLNVKLFIVDNSPDDSLRKLFNDSRTEYIFNNKNIGYGAAHNIAIRKVINSDSFHLVLNPDVYFEKGTLEKLAEFMQNNPETGLIQPKILYPDGSPQYLCKLLPTPFDLFIRRFFKNKKVLARRNHYFEYRFTDYSSIMKVPYLSGSFMFLRNKTLQKTGLFDERIFMYIEDADLTRRIFTTSSSVFYPEAVIYHHFAKGSHKKFKLTLYAIHGAIVYFNKWGWFFDRERKRINKKLVKKYTLQHKD